MEGPPVSENDQHDGVTPEDPLQDEFHRKLREEFDQIIQSPQEEECDDHDDDEKEEDYDCEDCGQKIGQQLEESATAATDMWLSTQEREYALMIKKAVEDQPELDNLNDYWYAHLAIFELKHQPQLSNNNNEVNVNANLLVASVLPRIHALQVFKQDQNIVETTACGKRVFQDCIIKFFPGWMLGLSYSPSDGGYTMVHDVTKIHKEVLNRNPRAMEIYLQFVYFFFQATSHNFLSCRTGIYSIAECEGQDFTKNFGLNFMRRLWTEIGTVYPMQFQKIEMAQCRYCPNSIVEYVQTFLTPTFQSQGNARFYQRSRCRTTG